MKYYWKVKRQFDPLEVVAPELDERDPEVVLALSGAVCLQADGLTDRINVDATDSFTNETPIGGSREPTTMGQSRSLAIPAAR